MTDAMSPEHRREAEERWGETEMYRQSSRRTASYGEPEWATIKAELEAIETGFAHAMEQGAPADSNEAMDLAERARQHIARWYYDCSHEMHGRLAAMYTADPRFRAHYDDRRPGLADYVAAAIEANGARQIGV